jgi:nucleoside 2-deoxyribosyltransferase
MAEPKPIVYLAQPIDQAGTFITGTTVIALGKAGCTVYDPRRAWSQVDGQAEVQHVNAAAIDFCDGVLAILPDDVPTVGTPIEIAYAVAQHKPVVVFGSARLAKSPVLASFEVPVYDTDAMAIARLVEWMNNDREQTVPVDETPIDRTPFHSPQVSNEADLDVTIHVGSDDASHLQYLREVHQEVNRAAAKFPLSDENGFGDWFAIWVEEVVEATQAYNDWLRTLKESGPGLEASEYHNALLIELVQVGAMAARFFESLSE